MTGKAILYSLVLLILSGFSSCGIYRPNVVNVPSLQHKGQAQLSGHISFSGYDGQASFALSDKMALVANYSNMGTRQISTSATNYTIDKHSFGEIGAGYYKKNKQGQIRELLLVAGTGLSSHFVAGGDTAFGKTPPFTTFRKANYNRFLIQADFGRSKGKFDYIFSPRVFVVHFYNIDDNEVNISKPGTGTFLWTDAAVTLRYSILSNLQISGQFGVTLPLTGRNDAYFESSPFNCSIGLICNLDLHRPSEKNAVAK